MKNYKRLFISQTRLISDKIISEHSIPNPNLKEDRKPIDNVTAYMDYYGKPPNKDEKNNRYDVTDTLTSNVDKAKENKKEQIYGNRENIFQNEKGAINKLDEITKNDEQNVNQESSSQVDTKPEDQFSS